VDRYGREILDEVYETPEFERIISLWARTEAVARHLTDFLKKTDREAYLRVKEAASYLEAPEHPPLCRQPSGKWKSRLN